MSKAMLHSLVDCIDANYTYDAYKLLVRFVAKEAPLPDEIEAIAETEGEYERGEYVSLDEAFA